MPTDERPRPTRMPSTDSASPAAERISSAGDPAWRALLDSLADGYFELDLTGRLTGFNRALSEITGYGPDELVGLSYRKVTDAETAHRLFSLCQQVYRTGEPVQTLGFALTHKDGSQRSVEVSVSLLRDQARQPCGFHGMLRDVGTRQRGEQATRRRTAELGALNRMGQALSRLAEPASLLNLIHTIIGQILDNKNLYIALYDESSQTISFPVYTIDGQPLARPARPFSAGLTEHIIRTKAPLFLSHDVMARAREIGIEPKGKPAHCFLGVPMLLGDKVSGVIAIQDYDRAGVYDQDHLEVLSTIASQAAVALENARLFAETRRRADQLQAINDVERVVTTTLDLEMLSAQIAQVLHTRLNLDAVSVGLVEGDELVFKAASGAVERGASLIDLRLKVGKEGVTGRVASSGETLLVPDVRLYPGFMRSEYLQHTLSELAVPLKTQAGVIGVLKIESEQVDAFSPELVALIETLASQIAIAIDNARLFAETQRLARTDPLTGIPNRRHLLEIGERELGRARRFGHALAALMLDIDKFKHVNDAYGHATGDQVLQTLSRFCQHHIRDVDTIGRYGGEEFVVLLVETDGVRAYHTAERLCEHIAHTAMETPQGPVSVTISVGVAERAESDDLTTLLARADQALYAAKQAGRNRVAVL